MHSIASLTDRIHGFITENFLYARPNHTLASDEPLLAGGIIDSLGVMELIAFIEEELGVTVADTDVTEANLGSVDAVAHYVARRQGEAASTAA